jgi:hypothetical protein
MQLKVGHLAAIESLQLHLAVGELRLSGTITNASAYAEVGRHLAIVHEHVVSQNFPSFVVDVRPLSLVNSSAVRLFVNWISWAEKARYRLVFLTERNVTWQRLSFSVLKSLSPRTVEIREEQPGAGDSA